MLRLALAAALPLLATLIATTVAAENPGAGDAVHGKRVFQRCYACHSVDPDETDNLQGPSLHGILGRPAAAIAGFDYSDNMRKRAADGLVWDAATLDAFIADPESVVPGTLMSMPPLRDAQERADLIAYLARSAQSRD